MSATMSNPSTPKILWVAVAVLGAATLGLGAMLLRSHEAAPTSGEPVALAPQTQTQANASATPGATATAKAEEVIQSSRSTTAAKPAAKQAAPKTAVKTQNNQPLPASGAAPVGTQQSAPVAVERVPAAPLCANCGTVESVTTQQRDAESGSGVGVIAGAALGGLLGNQVGGGTGKDLATIAGMAAGGWAGNTVEKKMKKETFYEVNVRMEDGSLRKFEQKAAVGVGTKVTVNGGALTPVAAAQKGQ